MTCLLRMGGALALIVALAACGGSSSSAVEEAEALLRESDNSSTDNEPPRPEPVQSNPTTIPLAPRTEPPEPSVHISSFQEGPQFLRLLTLGRDRLHPSAHRRPLAAMLEHRSPNWRRGAPSSWSPWRTPTKPHAPLGTPRQQRAPGAARGLLPRRGRLPTTIE